jgi:hypothetical protein
MFDFVVIVLCAASLVALLQNDPRLFEWRARWQTSTGYWGRLLRCAFCSSYWAAGISLLLVLPHVVFPHSYATLPSYLVAITLAAARAAQLANHTL